MAFHLRNWITKSNLQRSATLSPRIAIVRYAMRHSSTTSSPKPVISTEPTHITISHPSVAAGVKVPYTWLRDSCQCSECVHPTTRQKLHRTSDVPLDIGLAGEVELEHVAGGEWNVKVPFNKPLYQHDTTSIGIEGHPQSAPVSPNASAHVSSFPLSFLGLHSSTDRLRQFHHTGAIEPKAWLTKDLLATKERGSLYIPHRDIFSSPEVRLKALTQLVQYGVFVITDVPTVIPKPGEEWEVEKIANTFAEVRSTFYGKLFDVKMLPSSINVAYTDSDLDLHMDLLYFVSPPRYQLLHCLRNRVKGGNSLFVDALHAAHTLYREDPAAFEALASTEVRFWYYNDGHHLERKHKTFEVDGLDPKTKMPRITAINYSPPFQAPLSLSETPLDFYPALQKFAALLRRPEGRWEFLLKEGDLVIFDNRRLLHARSAFSDIEPRKASATDEPTRWLKGTYIEADVVLDQIRVLRSRFGPSV